MKFEELKRALKDKIYNNYLLFGNDNFLIDKSKELILDAVKLQLIDFNFEVFNGEIIDLKEVVKSCETLPMIDDKRVIYLDLSKDSKILNIALIEKYIGNYNNSTILIINDSNNLTTLNNENIQRINCDRLSIKLVESFVRNELKKVDKTIESKALEMLYNFTLGDMSKCDIEIKKLISYVGVQPTITTNDVEQIVNKSIEYNIFELTENLAKKNSTRVYEILDSMKSKKDSYRSLISLIYNHFRRLFFISISLDDNSTLSNLLGVKEYAITMSKKQCALFSKKSLKQICDLCADLDYKLKQSIVGIDDAINLLVLTILNI